MNYLDRNEFNFEPSHISTEMNLTLSPARKW